MKIKVSKNYYYPRPSFELPIMYKFEHCLCTDTLNQLSKKGSAAISTKYADALCTLCLDRNPKIAFSSHSYPLSLQLSMLMHNRPPRIMPRREQDPTLAATVLDVFERAHEEWDDAKTEIKADAAGGCGPGAVSIIPSSAFHSFPLQLPCSLPSLFTHSRKKSHAIARHENEK